MWRVKFVYFNSVAEFEDDCILEFDSDLMAWNMYDRLLSIHNVLAVYRPEKII